MAAFKIKKGFDIPLEGRPDETIEDADSPEVVAVYPHHVKRIKARPSVEVGDKVKIGSPLYYDKTREGLKFGSPAAGTVQDIILGDRRSLHTILIKQNKRPSYQNFPTYGVDELTAADTTAVLNSLLETGLIALIQERPFGRIPDPEKRPKSIFINAMNTAPFTPSAKCLIQGHEQAYRLGCAALKKFTQGRINLCMGPNDMDVIPDVQGVDKHYFAGPHPAGNTSTHIYHIDPMVPHDIVWSIPLGHLISLGTFFESGRFPHKKTICIGAPGAEEADRRYLQAQIGTPLKDLMNGTMKDAASKRFIRGDVLSGRECGPDDSLGFFEQSINVIPDTNERLFMGWISPGFERFSTSPSYLSKWTEKDRRWKLGTLLNGSKRSLVLSGKYEKVVPMNIMVDFLIKAVLAHDTDEAIELGILETIPEDYALCSFICPSKLDICGIIQKGLDEIEEEGI